MTVERQHGRQLEPPGAAEALLAAHYYQALLGHTPFAEDLKRLYAVLDTALAAGPPSGIGAGIDARGLLQLGPQALLAHAQASGRFVAQQAGHIRTAGQWARTWAGVRDVPEMADFAQAAAQGWLRLGQGHLAQARQGLAERRRALSVAAEAVQQKALAVFAGRWPLPAGAAEDLHHSFQLWRALGRPDEAVLLPAVLTATLDGEAASPVRLTLPAAIDWSPVEGRAALMAQVTELVRRLEAEAREAAAARERAAKDAGWRELPQRTPDLARRAERLYRRVVLRESWNQIAYRTGARRRERVRVQALEDARLLGIDPKWGSAASAASAASADDAEMGE